MIKFSKLTLISIAALLLTSGIVKAATTVTSEGVAAITSTINNKIYRKRAIENALQNIAIQEDKLLLVLLSLKMAEYFLIKFNLLQKQGY